MFAGASVVGKVGGRGVGSDVEREVELVGILIVGRLNMIVTMEVSGCVI